VGVRAIIRRIPKSPATPKRVILTNPERGSGWGDWSVNVGCRIFLKTLPELHPGIIADERQDDKSLIMTLIIA
jgi:hypothetical protein